MDFSAGEDMRPQKLPKRIARRIVEHIISHDLGPGTRLPVEAELGETLGVGKNTLREAMRLLESWGVITIRQGRNGGPVVRSPQPRDVREALTVQLLFSSASLQGVYEARCCIEPHSAMMAAGRLPDTGIQELRSSVARMRDFVDDTPVFLAENRRFHELIAAATGNVVMQAFIDTLKAVFDGSSAGVNYSRGVRLAVADAHERITDAVASRDTARAAREMEIHLREAGDYWGKQGRIRLGYVTWEG
ncbi:FadR/GntR family transcriptional regulator [Actinomadura alba]|uniref:FadR/GntR family transcriptional regulator n=1 Tax=Actinomadura alba TaxID=406431 RepID=UPI001C9C8DC9|nr:FadR/GntR family transcriptional regulator [Actinomadura alba]